MRVSAAARTDDSEFFDRIGREHDGFPFAVTDGPRLERLRQRLGALQDSRIVEPGCGAGHLTASLAEWIGEEGHVIAFDPSIGMLERARARTAAFANVTLQHAALEDIELPAAAFDIVLCFRVWPHFRDGERALRATAGWLRTGGRLVIVHWDGRERLAAIHASQVSTATDTFPARDALEPAMERHSLAVRTWIDTPEDIFIEAVKT
jgi:demethylmenaquinone methyltransferase/2-methoxy-6-polyprenyl-1,4-benzoquinol methylase